MLVIGVALATSSTFLVKPTQERFGKKLIIGFSLVIMFVCVMAFALLPSGALAMVPVFLFYFCFGVSYPTMLGLTIPAALIGAVIWVFTRRRADVRSAVNVESSGP